ncbi:DNA adenine methylase [Pedobacter sp. MC2016-24]|uniref:DNA adenine methylase n=1 Tax=Pedobacter sp. MC2016-24 TaxID=2780090 RepID=UPI00187F0FDC|nr:DNA adenine methylase [Pedobacter sp. MC2016-24]MBE9602661.1 DNA adenine methylase [Pedobacter sp. MC2016-24]
MVYNKTPLRYPGGKQKLTPFILDIINANNIINGHYCEPYAGGAGVGLELLLSKKVKSIHLNDANYGIYAFWKSILDNHEEFCHLIRTASLTVEEWRLRKEIVKNYTNYSQLEVGFSTFFLNRCNRSGILSGGVIGGNNQEGNYKMDARFKRNDLIRRIEAISLFKDEIYVTNFDAEYYIDNYIINLPLDNTLVYLDPPYYEKASNLYLNSYSKDDHAGIAEKIQNSIYHKWVLSYDGVPQILDLYLDRRQFLYDLQYNASKVYKGKEVFIFSDDLEIPLECSLKSIDVALQELFG